MDLAFTAEQEAIRDEFRRALAGATPRAALERVDGSAAGMDATLWTRLAELGWLGTAVAECYGGSGLDEVALCVLAEEAGRAMAAIPFSASIGGFAVGLRLAADAATRAALLPAVAQGGAIGVLLCGDGWQGTPRIAPGADGGATLSGHALNVLDGAAATHALACVQGAGGAALILIDLAGATRHAGQSQALDLLHPAASFVFDAAPVRLLAGGEPAERLWNQLLDRHALLVAFEQLGGAEAALQMACGHVQGRYAFGRPIASFQAIKHMLADMLVSIDLARSNCYFGASALAMDAEVLAEAAAVARISATDAFKLCARSNIQAHGALGVTWESDCHLFYRRAQALAGSPGNAHFWKERLIALLRHRHAPAALAA
jgi:alkylation response protein AidB-like acyl-CoA dehydrogenase